MIRAVLYSDQVIAANARIDHRLLDLIGGRGRRIGYVPSGPDPGGRFLAEKRAYYSRYGLALDVVCDPGSLPGRSGIDELLDCDAIHLSGGHTADFLRRLRRAGMMVVLRDWAVAGGLLVGTSAGAILMTPTIAVDALCSGGRPEDVTEAAALDLVPFEFFPHVQQEARYMPELLRYSAVTQRPIIACSDGDGVVVCGQDVAFVGEPMWISEGSVKPAWAVPPGALVPGA